MDYANRGRPPQKKGKKSTSKGRKPAGKKAGAPVPWGIVIIACLVVAGFVWFLASISGKSDEPAITTEQAVPAPTEQPQVQPESTLPDKPEERWQYIEELENHEVQVDVPEREIGPPKLMQCGSFRQLDDANTLKARIAMAGLESQVRESNGSNGRWFRVILGPYETKRDAERDRHKLQRVQVFNCQIWNWNL